MTRKPKTGAREILIEQAIGLIRMNGYSATSVEMVCQAACVSKGAFFHHFASKEALAEACLIHWDEVVSAHEANAPFNQVSDPVERVLAYLDYYIKFFSQPGLPKSCLVGTTVQEVADSHPELRDAANICFINVEKRLKAMLAAAARHQGLRLDTSALAKLWLAAIQGSFILAKASTNDKVVSQSLKHVRKYIAGLLGR